MKTREKFLTSAEEKQIVEAIQQAELKTSGEISVHIQQTADKDPMDHAKEMFYKLKMNETAHQNGVLFHILVDKKQFSIIGDKGIDEKVSADFWEEIKDKVIHKFKEKQYASGLIQGIELAGRSLKKYFPHQKNDINELSDEISKA